MKFFVIVKRKGEKNTMGNDTLVIVITGIIVGGPTIVSVVKALKPPFNPAGKKFILNRPDGAIELHGYSEKEVADILPALEKYGKDDDEYEWDEWVEDDEDDDDYPDTSTEPEPNPDPADGHGRELELPELQVGVVAPASPSTSNRGR